MQINMEKSVPILTYFVPECNIIDVAGIIYEKTGYYRFD